MEISYDRQHQETTEIDYDDESDDDDDPGYNDDDSDDDDDLDTDYDTKIARTLTVAMAPMRQMIAWQKI